MPIILMFVLIIGAFLTGSSIVNPQVKPAAIEEAKVETPSPSPSSTPTPTSVPQVKGNQIVPTPYDPIIDCGTDYQKANGKTVKAKKSLCDSWVNCQIYGNQIFRVSKEQCDESQRKIEEAKKQREGMVNCETQSGWVRMTKDDCAKAQNAWGSKIQSQQNDVENAMRTLAGLDAESWGAKNLDQLDNIRERVRQVQSSDPSVQEYANQIISFIEERIKQAQGN